jgi:hypothetical protein
MMMSTRGTTFVVVLHLSVYGLAQPGHAQVFFESKQSYRQAIELMRETEVVVESSMPEAKVIVQRGIDRQVILDITGRFSIAGYHGSRQNAGARDLAGPELAFRVSRTTGTLMLSSPEWTFIHHALLIDHLTIALPESITLKIRRLTGDELEDRR